MAEQKIIIDGLEVAYSGLFNVKELYKLIDEWLADNNYDKAEKLNSEFVRPDGKYLELQLEPARNVSDYVKYILKIKIVGTGIKDVEVTKDGKKELMNKGDVKISFGAVLETDYASKWAYRPTLFFVRLLVDKFVYKSYTQRFEAELKKHVTELHTQVKSFLNLYKY